MRILISTAAEGSFTRGAIKENISQPAATIIINNLEEMFGTHLFVRQGTVRKAYLTEAGRKVTNTFSRIVTGYDVELSNFNKKKNGSHQH